MEKTYQENDYTSDVGMLLDSNKRFTWTYARTNGW
jgi:hypothetical protein